MHNALTSNVDCEPQSHSMDVLCSHTDTCIHTHPKANFTSPALAQTSLCQSCVPSIRQYPQLQHEAIQFHRPAHQCCPRDEDSGRYQHRWATEMRTASATGASDACTKVGAIETTSLSPSATHAARTKASTLLIRSPVALDIFQPFDRPEATPSDGSVSTTPAWQHVGQQTDPIRPPKREPLDADWPRTATKAQSPSGRPKVGNRGHRQDVSSCLISESWGRQPVLANAMASGNIAAEMSHCSANAAAASQEKLTTPRWKVDLCEKENASTRD
ncbi:unnamed protein product [Protopolystoma xenopodis]|uniref:Uncharacterized protein n=1 Tax=Protopolystoma xenopodis TaxID=117903 RepID=A0A3S5FFQ9_9PLAT|nr:unnamed protein product [Protopolystoma xenopodis]